MLFNRFALRELRIAKGMSQSDFAEAVDRISVPYISQLETGAKPRPSADTLERICKALDVDKRVLCLEPTMAELIGEMDHARKREVIVDRRAS